MARTYSLSEPVAETLNILAERAKEFNEQEYPVKVKALNLTGSSVREAVIPIIPNDIDVIVVCGDVHPEYSRFCETLFHNLSDIMKEAERIKRARGSRRMTAEDVTAAAYGIMDEKWICWLSLLPVEYVRKMSIDPPTFACRYLMRGQKARNAPQLTFLYHVRDFPAVEVWSSSKQSVKTEFSEGEIAQYLRDERKTLHRRFKQLEEAVRSQIRILDTPAIYHRTLWRIHETKEKRGEDGENWLPKAAESLLDRVQTLLSSEWSSVEELAELNTSTSHALKVFAALGYTDRTGKFPKYVMEEALYLREHFQS